MDDEDWLARRFEEHRPHLRAVAYRMLGSLTEADDAVQDAWVRVSRAGADGVENLGGWLTTIVSRVCLNHLRSRSARREVSVEAFVPDPVVTREGQLLPEDEALLADSVGLALQVVIQTLSPAERLAFVLHDMFALPFEEIGQMIGRSSQATRQLASRARRRVRGAEIPAEERDVTRQRALVDAFLAAGRAGDLDALIAVLHPDVVLRADYSPSSPGRSTVIRGAEAVAQQARLGGRAASELHPALVNGTAGVVVTIKGHPFVVMAFTVGDDKITEIDIIGDPERVRRVAAPVLSPTGAA
ncbi:MAG: sigma-70 family RNA polymerase sigma factor [Acidimicrobiales bacterium]|nr:sigma-70 family RNA polymerase sigma factor [Acidimicrobiales bacterium]MBO0886857.1 sigma-70 family RNA polymerase sigma factor [Acidimicrobiales bacterium]